MMRKGRGTNSAARESSQPKLPSGSTARPSKGRQLLIRTSPSKGRTARRHSPVLWNGWRGGVFVGRQGLHGSADPDFVGSAAGIYGEVDVRHSSRWTHDCVTTIRIISHAGRNGATRADRPDTVLTPGDSSCIFNRELLAYALQQVNRQRRQGGTSNPLLPRR